MSLPNARIQPAPEPRREPTRWLRPVPAPTARRRPKLAYAALAVGGALAIGAAQMIVSLATTQDAFVLAQLNSEQHELTLQKQALNENIVGLSSPQALAGRADALGLVVAGSASYLRLSDGAVLGTMQGADWRSTVNPNGASKVGNALLTPPAAAQDETGASTETPVDAPPTIPDGLPSPKTR